MYSLLRLAVTKWLVNQGKDDLNSTARAGSGHPSIHRCQEPLRCIFATTEEALVRIRQSRWRLLINQW